MLYKEEFNKYLKLLTEVYTKYHRGNLSFKDKNKTLKDMKAIETIIDNLIYLCVSNEGFSKLELKLKLENAIELCN